jgi:phosphatidate cytidylyltransferase
MNLKFDKETAYLVGGVLAVLIIGTVIGRILKASSKSEAKAKSIQNLNDRVKAWWVMAAVFGLAMFTGPVGCVVLFGLISFLALREFITLTPTKLGDHGRCSGSFSSLHRCSITSWPRIGTGRFPSSSRFALSCLSR